MQVGWSAEQYVSDMPSKLKGFNGPVESRLEEMFPLLHMSNLPLIESPCIITDVADRILGWYLPGALSPARQVSRSGLDGSGHLIVATERCLDRNLVPTTSL